MKKWVSEWCGWQFQFWIQQLYMISSLAIHLNGQHNRPLHPAKTKRYDTVYRLSIWRDYCSLYIVSFIMSPYRTYLCPILSLLVDFFLFVFSMIWTCNERNWNIKRQTAIREMKEKSAVSIPLLHPILGWFLAANLQCAVKYVIFLSFLLWNEKNRMEWKSIEQGCINYFIFILLNLFSSLSWVGWLLAGKSNSRFE